MPLRRGEEAFDSGKQFEEALFGPIGKEHRVERPLRAGRSVTQCVDVHRAVQREHAAKGDQLQPRRQMDRRRETHDEKCKQSPVTPTTGLDDTPRAHVVALTEPQRNTTAPGHLPGRRLDSLEEPAARDDVGVHRDRKAGRHRNADRKVDQVVNAFELARQMKRAANPRPDTAIRTGPMLTDTVAVTDRLNVAPLTSFAVVTSSRRS